MALVSGAQGVSGVQEYNRTKIVVHVKARRCSRLCVARMHTAVVYYCGGFDRANRLQSRRNLCIPASVWFLTVQLVSQLEHTCVAPWEV